MLIINAVEEIDEKPYEGGIHPHLVRPRVKILKSDSP